MSLAIHGSPAATVVADVLGVSTDELAERDTVTEVLGRWVASDGADVLGLATAFRRPDDRVFVTHRLTDESAFGPLLEAAVAEIPGPVNVTIDPSAIDRRQAIESLGFRPELAIAAFEVPFDTALEMTERLRRPTRFEVVAADRVDLDRLFELDIVLRGSTPGETGWRGQRAWFDDELSSPEFDPAAYPVAVDPSDGAPVGLCRIWRNDDGPMLGLLGVVPVHRSGVVAGALLRTALTAASTWGWDTFRTHTARPTLQRRLRHLGAVETGGYLRLRRA